MANSLCGCCCCNIILAGTPTLLAQDFKIVGTGADFDGTLSPGEEIESVRSIPGSHYQIEFAVTSDSPLPCEFELVGPGFCFKAERVDVAFPFGALRVFGETGTVFETRFQSKMTLTTYFDEARTEVYDSRWSYQDLVAFNDDGDPIMAIVPPSGIVEIVPAENNHRIFTLRGWDTTFQLVSATSRSDQFGSLVGLVPQVLRKQFDMSSNLRLLNIGSNDVAVSSFVAIRLKGIDEETQINTRCQERLPVCHEIGETTHLLGRVRLSSSIFDIREAVDESLTACAPFAKSVAAFDRSQQNFIQGAEDTEEAANAFVAAHAGNYSISRDHTVGWDAQLYLVRDDAGNYFVSGTIEVTVQKITLQVRQTLLATGVAYTLLVYVDKGSTSYSSSPMLPIDAETVTHGGTFGFSLGECQTIRNGLSGGVVTEIEISDDIIVCTVVPDDGGGPLPGTLHSDSMNVTLGSSMIDLDAITVTIEFTDPTPLP